PERYLRDLAYR
ncbi:hypothetical protein VCHENC02_4976B, partial [Vibrio harveyi]